MIRVPGEGYDDAVAAVRARNADGIGYMLLGSGIGAIDLDHCVDQETARLAPWAEQLHDEAEGAYQEVTVSGGGLRLLALSVDRRRIANSHSIATPAPALSFTETRRGSSQRAVLRLAPVPNYRRSTTLCDAPLAHYSGHARQRDGLDFNDARRQSSSIDYDDLIRNGAPEGQRSEQFQAVVASALKGHTTEQITDELGRHPNGIGAKYADRLHAEVKRSYEKWRLCKCASATGGAPTDNSWPQIFVVAGELPRVVSEAEEALLALDREIFQRGGLIVRPVLSKLKASDDRDMMGWRLIRDATAYGWTSLAPPAF